MIIRRTSRTTVFHTKNVPRIIELLKEAKVEARVKESKHAITTHLNRRLTLAELNRLRVALGQPIIKGGTSRPKEEPTIIRGFKGCLATGKFIWLV